MTDADFQAYDSFASDIKSNISALSRTLNKKYAAALVDLNALFEYIEDQPTTFGLDAANFNPVKACLLGSYPGTGERTLCEDPEKHLFFDLVIASSD